MNAEGNKFFQITCCCRHDSEVRKHSVFDTVLILSHNASATSGLAKDLATIRNVLNYISDYFWNWDEGIIF